MWFSAWIPKMEKCANLVELENATNFKSKFVWFYLQGTASMQPRTDRPKFLRIRVVEIHA